MNKNHAKRRRDIKTKLMAAICMLLVSSIMMVSTTYAWFTLSTAPEVTGINTAVGANGNLEMALLPKDGLTSSITSSAGDSVKDIEERNVTWGNLVDLSESTIYGLDKITLYPAALNLTAEGKVDVNGFILKTPTYGADGRVAQLNPNAQTGYFDKVSQTFAPNDDFGVRAVGTASGMTDRQLDYRNARSAANTAKSQAANKASTSLNTNGSALANIAIEYGMGADTASFDKTDVASLRSIINDLNGNGGVLELLETAYMQYILAAAASSLSGTDDLAWQAVKGAVNEEDATLESVMEDIGDYIPAAVSTGIAKYNEIVAAVNTADTKLAALEAELANDDAATFTWAQIREAMEPLADPAAIKVNGFKASEVKENLGALVSSVTSQGGLRVIMETGAGVYADIADQSGDYTAAVNIAKVEYNGIVLENMAARMETATTVNPTYLTLVGAAVEGKAPASGADTVLPISDMYGYIIDLAFRTNAAESKLLLQPDAVDRIYTDNTNEETMGHGASMTFLATTPDFTDDQVKSLMDAIKIIFFNPVDGTIYCYAGLDIANATLGADGWTAKMYLYKLTAAGTSYELATAEQKADDDTVLYTKDADADTYSPVADKTNLDEGTEYFVKVETTAGKQEIADNAIMALTQNTAHALSVLVYLDGEEVTNADVAATGSTSMTGKMNLQFASSATLVPMEYSGLYIPGQAGTQESTPAESQAAGG